MEETGEDDIQDVYEEQVVPLKVEGEWDFTTDIPRCIISNHEEIQRKFQQINENISRLSLIVKCIFLIIIFHFKILSVRKASHHANFRVFLFMIADIFWFLGHN